MLSRTNQHSAADSDADPRTEERRQPSPDKAKGQCSKEGFWGPSGVGPDRQGRVETGMMDAQMPKPAMSGSGETARGGPVLPSTSPPGASLSPLPGTLASADGAPSAGGCQHLQSSSYGGTSTADADLEHSAPSDTDRAFPCTGLVPGALPRLSSLPAEVWGWLRPAPGTNLPFVMLQGSGVAIGRGRDAYLERLPQLMPQLSIATSISAALSSLGLPPIDASESSSAADAGSGGVGAPARASSSHSSGTSSLGFCGGISASRERGAGRDGCSPRDKDTVLDSGSWSSNSSGSSFVEVADGRVSRLHAWVRWNVQRQQAELEDFSSNGTFVNGNRVGRGCLVALADGDRVSLVLSVAPLAEQAFIFHTGDPRGLEGDSPKEWAPDAAAPWVHRKSSQVLAAGGPATSSPTVAHGSEPGAAGSLSGALNRSSSGGGNAAPVSPPTAARRRLARCSTSQYSTLQAITLEDLQCQVCLCTLRDCVALEPCGHNFCASCLSHHLAALLTSGQPLACPLRCAPPKRVVINSAVRQLLSSGAANLRAPSALLRQLSRRHQSLQQHVSSSQLEPVAEGLPSTGSIESGGLSFGSSASSLHSGCHSSSQLASSAASAAASDTHIHSQRGLPLNQPGSPHLAAPQALAPSAATPAPPAAVAATAAAQVDASVAPDGGGSDGGASGSASSAASPQHYRHVALQMQLASPDSHSSGSISSLPASPFELLATSTGFPSLRNSDSGPLALPGEPTMPAACPLGAAQSTDAVQGRRAAPEEPTIAAEVPLTLRQPSTAVSAPSGDAAGGMPGPSGAVLPAAAPSWVTKGNASLGINQGGSDGGEDPHSRSSQRQEEQQRQQQEEQHEQVGAVATAEGPGTDQPADDSVGGRRGDLVVALPNAFALTPASSEAEGDALLPMHPLCPLDDSVLPLDTAGLKSRQLTRTLDQLQSAGDDEDATMNNLDALARLAWSDEAARQELGQLEGVQAVVRCMRQHLESEGVQCTGCLALMALVRGEETASTENRLRLADCEGVQAIAEGMREHEDAPMVQLSALLCLVPLALENTYLQVLVARSCLPAILNAMRRHMQEEEVVSKALIMLGVLGQGDDEAHEVVRHTIMACTPFPRIAALALREQGTGSEEVLWSALFALTVIARDSSPSYVAHLLRLASAGVLPALEVAMCAYRESLNQLDSEPDEMILRAGDYLTSVLRKARQLLWIRRTRRLTRLALVGLAALAAFRWLRHRAAHRHSGGAGGGR